MFCYQCEQTAGGTGCTNFGVCGKGPETSDLQDLLNYIAKGVSMYAHRARQLGKADREVDVFTVQALFTTVTNVNFDTDDIREEIERGLSMREKAKKLYEQACREAGEEPERLDGPASWQPPADDAELLEATKEVSIERRQEKFGETVTGLQELIFYGLKGSAAYLDHAQLLDYEDDDIYAQLHEMMDYLASNPTDINELVGKALEAGEFNFKVMELLDSAHTETYGHPEPTDVPVHPEEGKAILVSGHDLKDLYELLKQTEGTGIKVYTHGEMLPAHGYPELNKFDHLVGNYGGAWQEQRREFDEFPGSILMTTNCLQEPRDSYKDRIFTKNRVGWPGVEHIEGHDYSQLIEAAQQAPGFEEDGPNKTITVGFGHNAIEQAAGDIVEAVEAGDLRHFFFIGGCDGAKPGRNYYTELAEEVPEDCAILTAACGKYRFNKKEFGTIGDLPRLIDTGQCNDSYSTIQAALALSEAFDCGVNELPLDLVVSWFEQKAVAILLTLLHLGIEDIRLGPTPPAFVTDDVFEVLQDEFNLMPIDEAQSDLEAMLAG